MSEDEQPNIEEIKKQLDEVKAMLALSDEEMKKQLISDIEEMFNNPEQVKAMRDAYEVQIKQLEGMILFLEGLEKMASSMEQKLNVTESVEKVLNFGTEPKE